MRMRTILTKKQQQGFLSDNWRLSTLTHKWSTRGMGRSKIIDSADVVLGTAGGCGYDRYGTALGNAIEHIFKAELLILAKRECSGKRKSRMVSSKFYGLFYNAEKNAAYFDGGCGSECMVKILNKIGFSLKYVGESSRASAGEAFYVLSELAKNDRAFLNRG